MELFEIAKDRTLFAYGNGESEKAGEVASGLTFIGKLFGEAEMLALANAHQDSTGWHLKHPKL